MTVLAAVVGAGAGVGSWAASLFEPRLHRYARAGCPTQPAEQPTVAHMASVVPPTTEGTADSGATAAERRLLREASSTLLEGASLALDAIEEHERRFPNGPLSQMRENLRARALVALEPWQGRRSVDDSYATQSGREKFGPRLAAAIDARYSHMQNHRN